MVEIPMSLNGGVIFVCDLLRVDLLTLGLDIFGGGLGIGALFLAGGRFLSISLFETV